MGITRRQFLHRAAATATATGLASAWPLGCASSSGEARKALAERSAPLAVERTVFQHGVASGDPLADRVILWTRVSGGSPDPVEVAFEVARDPGFADIATRGRTTTFAARDHTVKIDAEGLEPGQTYYYRFEALGEASPIGRTRTLPTGRVDHLRIAFTSCSNYPYGFFNVYGLIARRHDLDAVLHLGDYFYEYANGSYGDGTRFDRVPEPIGEIVTLADYRLRHAVYKTDPDLQEVHRQHPFITVWDDHESANDSWRGGAENHQPQVGEGDWKTRMASAIRAYHEWMPIRDVLADRSGRIFRSFRFGDLADLVMLDTRLHGRDRQIEDRSDAVAIADPSRSLLGPEQEAWLERQLRQSSHEAIRWRLLGQQVVMAQIVDDRGIRNPDQWDGYPASRGRLFDLIEREAVDNLVVMTGDVHSSWANEVARDPFDPARYDPRTGRGALAVEFVSPAVSSPAPGNLSREAASQREKLVHGSHPHIHFVDLYRRGYVVVDVDRERVQADWFWAETVEERRLAEEFARGFRVESGRAHLVPVDRPSPSRDRQRLPAPV